MSPPNTPTVADWAILLLLASFWSASFMLTAMALRSFPPAMLAGARIAIGAVIMAAVLRFSAARLPRSPRTWIALFIVALLTHAVPFNLIAWGQQHVASGMTAILLAIVPLFVIALSHFFVPGERLSLARGAGFTVGFIGALVVVSPGADTLAPIDSQLWGLAAILTAAFCYACGSVVARRMEFREPLSMSAGVLVLACAATLPAALMQAPETSWPPKVESAIAVLFLGGLSTGLASVLYFRLVQGPGPAFLSTVNYIVPPLALLLGAAILDESIHRSTIFGMVLILIGIGISEFGPRARPDPGSAPQESRPESGRGEISPSPGRAPAHDGANDRR